MNLPLDEIKSNIIAKEDVHIAIICDIFGIGKEEATNKFNSELAVFLNRLSQVWLNAKQNKKPTISVAQGVNIFIEVMQMGLTFSESQNFVYIGSLPPLFNQISYQVTVDGRIYLAQQAGSISHLSEAVIVRNDEDFKICSNKDGSKYVEHTIDTFNKPFKFLEDFKCGYVFVTYPSGAKELKWVDFNRMKTHSYDKANSYNKSMYDGYSFLQTKIIKYALRKERVKAFAQSSVAIDDDIVDVEYGFDTIQEPDADQASYEPTPELKPEPTPEKTQENQDQAPNLLDGLDFNFNF